MWQSDPVRSCFSSDGKWLLPVRLIFVISAVLMLICVVAWLTYTVTRSVTERCVLNLPVYTVVNLFYYHLCDLLFVLVRFLLESSTLERVCINDSHRWSLSKFWGFPEREELEFFHCDWQIWYCFISCWSMSKHKNGGVANLLMQKELRKKLFV